MSTRFEAVQRHLQLLRGEFDAAFARPHAAPAEPGEVLLRLSAGGLLLGVKLAQVAGIHRLPQVVRLPGSPAGLLGLAGLRGQLVAVHDLASHLGLTPQASPSWLLLCAGQRRVGLAVSSFEGQLRATREQLQPTPAEGPAPHVRSLALLPGAPALPVLDVDSLLQALVHRASAPFPER